MNALTCYRGARVGPIAQCVAKDNESCISGLVITPTIEEDKGSEVFSCGNCEQMETSGLTSVTCCQDADNCQPMSSQLPDGICDSLNDEESCLSQTDCYWCVGSVAGVGLCKTLVGYSNPCFTIPVLNQQCPDVACPKLPNKYNATRLTLKFLTDFGLPKINDSTIPQIGFDLFSRDIRIFGLKHPKSNCKNAWELQNWCGFNSTNNYFKYCIVSEKWPQEDSFGWLSSTTYTANSGTNLLFPAVCACNNPGRAFYFPTQLISLQSYFESDCPTEKALLTMYIVLIVCTTLVFIFVLYDTIDLMTQAYTNNFKFGSGKTAMVKVCLIIYFLLTIPCQVISVAPYYTAQHIVAGVVLKRLGSVFFLFAYSNTIFTFFELIMDCKLFGDHHILVMCVHIFKWFFMTISGILLVALITVDSIIGWYYEVCSF